MKKYSNLIDELNEVKEILLEGVENEDWDPVQDAIDYIEEMILDYGSQSTE